MKLFGALTLGAAVAASWLALARAESEQEALVRRYVQAWNERDVDRFLDLARPGARTWRRDSDEDGLAGRSIAGDDTAGRARYYRGAFAKQPHPRVDIVQLQALDDLVVSRERISGGGDGGVSDALTVYQVRDRKICNVWHIKRKRH